MAKFQVRAKTPQGPKVISCLTSESTLQQFLVECGWDESTAAFKLDKVKILKGFPPRSLDLLDPLQTLESLSITHGDSVIIESKENTPISDTPSAGSTTSSSSTMGASGSKSLFGSGSPDLEPSKSKKSKTESSSSSALQFHAILLRQTVPANNSCLFTSVNFCLSGKVDLDKADFMRDVISAAVSSDTHKYNAAILGKENEEYCAWIRKDASWGGAIEAQILAEYFGVVVSLVNIQTDFMTHFGENMNLAQRMLLIYDGIHYDPLYRDLGNGEKQTLFTLDDEKVLEEAKNLAKVARTARQFVDVSNFSLKCITCQTNLKGQEDAQKHAKDTGHTNFGEI